MGAVTAVALAAEGARVVFCGRRLDEGRAVEKAIRDAGGDGLFVQADVTSEDQVRVLVATVEARHGRLDHAFNNVGTGSPGAPLHELATADFDMVMTTNLRGNFLQMKYEIPLMLKSGGGSIVGNSSIAGIRYLANNSHYTGAKHGVIGMYCAAAIEYAKQGIRINVVCPGFIKTEKAMKVTGGNEKIFDSRIPMGRIGYSRGRRRRGPVVVLGRVALRHRHRASGGRRSVGAVSGCPRRRAAPPTHFASPFRPPCPSTQGRRASRLSVGCEIASNVLK